MEKSDKITLVTVCDNHYMVLLGALAKSIEQHHKTSELIELIVVEDRVSRSNKRKLENSVDPAIIQIRWIPMPEAIPGNMNLPLDRSSYPINIYLRVFIPWFVPVEVSKVLYLDVDMIMLSDISELWNIEIGDFPLGAVQDPRIKTVDNSWGGIKNYAALGLAAKTKYFNTGLLLIDTRKWRELHIAPKVLDCAVENSMYLNYPDQYALNVVFADNWFEIDPSWNHFVTSEHPETARIVHFVERKPIYTSYKNSKSFQEVFYHYLAQTEWKGAKKISEFSRYTKKLRNLMSKLHLK